MPTFSQQPKTTLANSSIKLMAPRRTPRQQGAKTETVADLRRSAESEPPSAFPTNDAEMYSARVAGPTLPGPDYDFARLPVCTAKAGALQTQLAISRPGDEHEKQAGRVAELVMRMPESRMERARSVARTGARSHAENQVSDPLRPPAKQVESGDLRTDAAPTSVYDALRTPGEPLDKRTRAFMELRLGYDFSCVRVHSDAAADRSARDTNSRAFTVGQHIVFKAGQFAPGMQEGLKLLAHELVHVVQQSSGAVTRVARDPDSMDPRHARGFVGEQDMGFIHYRQEDGWILFEGPGGAAGHGVTQRSFDAVAYNTNTGEVHLVDNKSWARKGNVGSATAIDPTRNLGKNLDALITRVEAAKDVPGRIGLLQKLRALKSALAAGKPLPNGIKLVVTGVGGNSTGVTPRLNAAGVEFRPEPERPPITSSPAKSPAAGPKPTTPSVPHVQEPPASVKPPAVTPKTAPPTVPVQEPLIAVPGAKPPVATSQALAPSPVSAVPSVAPPVRPAPWKAGLKAGGKALLVMLVFAGLEYLVRRGLDKKLEASLEMARKGSQPWAERLKREDPSKPVYVSFKIQSEDYSNFVPLMGWMPEAPKLHMISMALVRAEIDPPIVDVEDRAINVWRPAATTTTTHPELLVP